MCFSGIARKLAGQTHGAQQSHAEVHRCVQADLLHALEAITAQADLLLDLRGPVLESLVPALAQAIRGEQESGDARFLCLKLLCDITLPFLASDGQEASGADSGDRSSSCSPHIFAAYPHLHSSIG